MGVLAPMFLAGLAALSLPVLLHLIRRTPRGRQNFSSLMFLSPSPPRLTRRSRIDQWLLLLLRLGALALVAFAFARPFLRETVTLSLDSLPARKVALLIDTSASMRRGDLWPQAVAVAERQLDDLGPDDAVALYAYSDRLRTLVEFENDRNEPTAARVDLVRHELKLLEPTWGATDLGLALISVAAELDAAIDIEQSSAQPQIVLIGDFQQGSRVESLQSFAWPERVRVTAHPVKPRTATNAFVRPLFDEEQTPGADLRVRVANSSDSTGDQFFVRWEGEKIAADSAREVAVYVPPGQARVVRMPHTPDDLLADRIVLRGDDQDFDNSHYIVPPRKQTVELVYVGDDTGDDPQGLLHYLGLAVANDPLRQVNVQHADAQRKFSAGTPSPQLAVVSRTVSTAEFEALGRYAEAGGTVWLVARDRASAALVPRLFDDIELQPEQPLADGKYLLLGEIDFGHPLFQPFANPRYSDFTRIHFWNRQPVAVGPQAAAQVVARFDDGAPAILDRRMGAGRVLAFLFAWNPDDSQLALSSKFVPLVGGILDQACGGGEAVASVAVHEPVALAGLRGDGAIVVYTPDGREVQAPAGSEAFGETNLPGIYRAMHGNDELRFAVNLAAAESRTAPLDIEQLEQWGVRFGVEQTRAERLTHQRQQRDIELESRQQAWRWLIVAALAVLFIETWLAGRSAQRITNTSEAAA